MKAEDTQEDKDKLIDSLRKHYENPTEWKVRRAFLMKNYEKLPIERLQCLSRCFVNVELYGAAYIEEVMIQIQDLGDGVIKTAIPS